MVQILDGKLLAQKVIAEVKAGVSALKERTGAVPTLAVVLAGDFPPSKIYIANKKKMAAEVGIASRDFLFPEGLSQADPLALRRRLGAAPAIHGILLQLPLPGGCNEEEAIAAIAPEKDVDGLHPTNLGHLPAGPPPRRPCPPAGGRG